MPTRAAQCPFSTKKTAQRIQQNDRTAIFKKLPPEDTARNLACYNAKTRNPKGRLVLTIESGVWKVQTASFFIVDDHKKNTIGRNLLPRIGIKLVQEKQTHKVLNVQEREESNQRINNGSRTIFNHYAGE